MGVTTRRVVLDTVVAVLMIGGTLGGVAAGILYWHNSLDHAWYTAGLAVAFGLAVALGSWFVAAAVTLAVEMADSLRTLVAVNERRTTT